MAMLFEASPLTEVLWGTLLTITTVFLHGAGMLLVFEWCITRWPAYEQDYRFVPRTWFIASLVLLMLFTHFVDIVPWAVFFRGIGAFADVRIAYFFAAATYTTLGYDDVMLPPGWHILAPVLAVNGLLTFGWSTGMLVSMLQQFYTSRLDEHGRLKPEAAHRLLRH